MPDVPAQAKGGLLMKSRTYNKRAYRTHVPLVPAGMLACAARRICKNISTKYGLGQHKSDKHSSGYFCWDAKTLFWFLLEITSESLHTQIKGFRSRVLKKRVKRRLKNQTARSIYPTVQGLYQARCSFPYEILQEVFIQLTAYLAPWLVQNCGYKYLTVFIDGDNVPFPAARADLENIVSTAGEKKRAAMHLNGALLADSDIFLDVEIQPGSRKNEHSAALTLVERVTAQLRGISDKPILFVMDRGYFNYRLVTLCEDLGVRFLIRLKENVFSGFTGGRGTDCEIDMESGKILIDWQEAVAAGIKPEDLEQLPDLPRKNVTGMNIRVVEENGGTYVFKARMASVKINAEGKDMYEYLITNLPAEEYDLDALRREYIRRWQIETNYSLLKHGDGMIYFHSAQKNLVLQEIYARLFQHNRAAAILNRRKNSTEHEKYISQPVYADNVKSIKEWFTKGSIEDDGEELIRGLRYQSVDPARTCSAKERSHRSAQPFNYRSKGV